MDREAIQQRFGIIGTSSAMRHVVDQVRLVAGSDASVLIQGESGVGKEVIAKTIHELSDRRHKPLIVVNCGAIPEGLLESELFGNEKGAYTGASEKRTGYFEGADNGTIFLDEIGEMPLQAQVRLLRVLESGEFSRVGSSVVRKVDVRIVAATNKDLSAEVAESRFREDLYYRLSTVVIDIPPLRKRKEDVLPLVDKFLRDITVQYNSPPKRLSPEARDLLTQYRWPGNVRELRNVMERIVVLNRAPTVSADDLRPYLRGVSASGSTSGLVAISREAGREFGSPAEGGSARERELIYRALLELRLEIREIKEQLQSNGIRTNRIDPDDSEYMIVKRSADEDEPFEEVVYEIEHDDEDDRSDSEFDARFEENGVGNGRGDAADDDVEGIALQLTGGELPTLQDAERQLISEALIRFDGNRRQTARALGISERTLYRKINEMEQDRVAE